MSLTTAPQQHGSHQKQEYEAGDDSQKVFVAQRLPVQDNPRLPGSPDIVLRKYRTCIFVNGCFWHGHEGCRYYTVPKTNTEFWVKKVARNKERDKEEQQRLAQMGWHCITVWECELKKNKREQTLVSLAYTLNHIYLKDRLITYQVPEEDAGMMIAAEPEPQT